MGLFSKKVAVNIDDVVKFRKSVDSFVQMTYNAGDNLLNILMEMEAVANQRANELEHIAASYDQLYSSIKQLESDISNRISSLKAQLGNIPKELEKKSTDKEGNVKVKKTPNPEYKALETQIQKESSRLVSVKELSWKVYNEVSHSQRIASELASAANELKNIIPELQRNARDVISKTEAATHSLENAIRTINNYLSFNFRV